MKLLSVSAIALALSVQALAQTIDTSPRKRVNCGGVVTSTALTLYPLTAAHDGCTVAFTSDSDISISVPSGLVAGFTFYAWQVGFGKITFVESGSIIRHPQDFRQTTGPGAKAELFSTSGNEFALHGSLKLPEVTGGGPGPDPVVPTKFISTFGACGGGTADRSTEVQAALTATLDNESLSFDCKPYVLNVSLPTGRTGVTITATNNGGFVVTGTPDHDDWGLKVESCTGCTVDGLTIDGQQKDANPLQITSNTNLTVKNNRISNTGSNAYAAIRGTGDQSGVLVTSNTLDGTTPIFDGGPPNVLDFGTRGIWLGEGSETCTGCSATNNTGTGMGHTFIVINGSNAYVAGNRGNSLTGACIKLAMNESSSGTSTVENNECHGALNGWTHDGGTRPTNGGNMQIGMLGTTGETVIIQDNWFDGGDGLQAVAGVHNAIVRRNILTDGWGAGGMQVTQSSNTGTLLIDRNIFGKTHASPNPPASQRYPNGIEIIAPNGITLSQITISNNLFANAHFRHLHIVADSGGTVSNVSITGNSFIGQATSFNGQVPWGIEIEGSGTLSSISQSGNCFVGHGSGSINGGGIGNPSQVSSCPNPTGKALPAGYPAIP